MAVAEAATAVFAVGRSLAVATEVAVAMAAAITSTSTVKALDTFFPKRLDIKRHLPKGSLSRLGISNSDS